MKHPMQKIRHIPRKQQGAVLVVSLMILLLLTLLAVSSSQTILMQEKMTAAIRDQYVALDEADAALACAESYLAGFTSQAAVTAAVLSQPYFYSSLDAPASGGIPKDQLFDDATWAGTLSEENDCFDIEDSPVPGRWMVEFYENATESVSGRKNIMSCGYHNSFLCNAGGGSTFFYRAYARGYGRSANTQRVLIGTYSVVF